MAANYIPRQSRDSSTFDGTYQTLGGPLGTAVVILKIVNDSDQDVDVSVDGTTDHDFVSANSYAVYDVRTNSPEGDNSFLFKKGLQFYVKGNSGAGSVYLIGIGEGA